MSNIEQDYNFMYNLDTNPIYVLCYCGKYYDHAELFLMEIVFVYLAGLYRRLSWTYITKSIQKVMYCGFNLNQGFKTQVYKC